MNLKEYLHFYTRSPFKYTYSDGDIVWGILESYNDWGMMCGDDVIDGGWYEFELYSDKSPGKFQFILTRLKDMSEDQKREYELLTIKREATVGFIDKLDTPLSIKYLFDNSIDVFGLIDKRLAIDSKTLEPIILNSILDRKEKDALKLENYLNPPIEETKPKAEEPKISFPFVGKYSERKKRFKNTANYNNTCTVIRKNRKGDSYYLLWDGQKKATYVHVDLIQPI